MKMNIEADLDAQGMEKNSFHINWQTLGNSIEDCLSDVDYVLPPLTIVQDECPPPDA